MTQNITQAYISDMDALKRLLEHYGTQQNMAIALGVSQAAVSQWLSGQKKITPDRARDIEKRSGGHVTAVELIFGEQAT